MDKLAKETGNGYEADWQIPPEPDADWTVATKQTHQQFQNARQSRQAAMDAEIAASAPALKITDRPYADASIVRVTGPFTMDSLSPHRILSTDEEEQTRPQSEREHETQFLSVVRQTLTTAGIKNPGGKGGNITFTEDLQPWARDGKNSEYIQFKGIYHDGDRQKIAAVCIGPEYSTVSRAYLVAAAREAADMFDTLIILGFAFEAHADKEMTNIGKMPVIRVRINNDLHISNLTASQNSKLFVAIGEPDITCTTLADGQLQVRINGIDIFDPVTGEVRSSDSTDIACWLIDTDYNGESFFVRLAYFPDTGGRDHYKKLKTALKGEIDPDIWAQLNKTVSHPFPPPATGKIAVKAITHTADELLKILTPKK